MATTKILEVSALAAEKFHDILKEQGEDDGMLRVMVMPGAQGGMQYVLSVEKEAGDGDFVIDTSLGMEAAREAVGAIVAVLAGGKTGPSAA